MPWLNSLKVQLQLHMFQTDLMPPVEGLNSNLQATSSLV